jgi:hypothetical protein
MSLSEIKDEIRRLTAAERKELTELILDLENDRDEDWLVEMLCRARGAQAGEGLVSQEDVEALHRRLSAEGR